MMSIKSSNNPSFVVFLKTNISDKIHFAQMLDNIQSSIYSLRGQNDEIMTDLLGDMIWPRPTAKVMSGHLVGQV